MPPSVLILGSASAGRLAAGCATAGAALVLGRDDDAVDADAAVDDDDSPPLADLVLPLGPPPPLSSCTSSFTATTVLGAGTGAAAVVGAAPVRFRVDRRRQLVSPVIRWPVSFETFAVCPPLLPHIIMSIKLPSSRQDTAGLSFPKSDPPLLRACVSRRQLPQFRYLSKRGQNTDKKG